MDILFRRTTNVGIQQVNRDQEDEELIKKKEVEYTIKARGQGKIPSQLLEIDLQNLE